MTLSLIALVAPLSSCVSGKRDAMTAMQAGDYESAIAISIEDAEAGDARAQFLAGLMHENGNGTAIDLETAARYYRQAALQGHPAAQNNLGLMHFEGRGVDKSIAEARKWLGRSAEQGFDKAQDNLAVVQITDALRARAADTPGQQPNATAIDSPMTLAASGADNLAARASGSLTPTKPSSPQARSEQIARWYLQAAREGSPTAQHMVGLMYVQGRTVDRNAKKAAEWFERAADQGFAQSQLMIGFATLNGLGVRKDEEAALRWMTLAAEQGLAQAQMSLGLMYIHGQGTGANTATGMNWLRLAAEQGLPQAQYNLALTQLRMRGGDAVDQRAMAHLRSAALAGHAPSMQKMGDLYQSGRGVNENPVVAMAWYGIASEAGDELATERRRQLASHMTKEQLTAAQAKLEEFRQYANN